MSSRRAFTLIEVLFSAALLGVVVAACVPMLAPRQPPHALQPDLQLKIIAGQARTFVPSSAEQSRFSSRAGESVQGEWIVTLGPGGYVVVWHPANADAQFGADNP